jgi:putative transposase
LAKIYCELYRTDRHTYVAKPWLTVLRDVYTGEPLARWISFSRPSRVAVAMVMRSCLRRHGRLPETISVDKGAEFLSCYLSSLAAHYGVHLEIRPSANSRFGGQIERLFGLFRSLWLDRCIGNCTDIKQVRGLSSSHHPRNMKCMRLPDFLREFDAFCLWFTHEKLGRATTPFTARNEGLERFPFSGIVIPYNDAFVIASAVDHGTLVIDGSRGIKIGDEHYWHPELRGYAMRGAVDVRSEPEDHTCIYARLGNHWVTAMSSRHLTLASESEHVRLAESLLVTDTKYQRARAKADSAEALVQIWRDSDRDFSTSRDTSPPSVDVVPSKDAKDLWNMIRSSAVEGLTISAWRANS